MSNQSKKVDELHELELDGVTGGAGSKQLLGHELTNVQQQKASNYIGETEKNLSAEVEGKRIGKQAKKIVAQSGSGSI